MFNLMNGSVKSASLGPQHVKYRSATHLYYSIFFELHIYYRRIEVRRLFQAIYVVSVYSFRCTDLNLARAVQLYIHKKNE